MKGMTHMFRKISISRQQLLLCFFGPRRLVLNKKKYGEMKCPQASIASISMEKKRANILNAFPCDRSEIF